MALVTLKLTRLLKAFSSAWLVVEAWLIERISAVNGLEVYSVHVEFRENTIARSYM